jgi:hypothetical protein
MKMQMQVRDMFGRYITGSFSAVPHFSLSSLPLDPLSDVELNHQPLNRGLRACSISRSGCEHSVIVTSKLAYSSHNILEPEQWARGSSRLC